MVAQKFGIESLKQAMVVCMYRHLPRYRRKEQVLEVLRIFAAAEELKDQSLKVAAAAAIKWICPFAEIVDDYQWKQFKKSHSELADKLCLIFDGVKA